MDTFRAEQGAEAVQILVTVGLIFMIICTGYIVISVLWGKDEES